MSLRVNLKKNSLSVFEIGVILLLACVPLFVTFPYRVNIFLSWEGAYRISQGELPFRDFGLPMGGMYWAIPGIFFKLFGTQMITLVKAQVFINILSGLAFRSILKSLDVPPATRFASVLLYCLSYSFFNFWPWYNHTVIVYEFIGLAFLFKALSVQGKKHTAFLALAAFFTLCSFFTKQDAGAMAVLISLAVLFFNGLQERKWKSLFIFTAVLVIMGVLIVLPFLGHGFGYWFNHGQPPHSARISLMEIVQEFFINSVWIKFYLFLIAILAVIRFRSWKAFWQAKADALFLLLTLAILWEAAVFQVTSYTPPDNNVFFHSFAIAYILTQLVKLLPAGAANTRWLGPVTVAGVLLWWSNVYWRYIDRVLERAIPAKAETIASAENVVNRQTYMILPKDTLEIPLSEWVFSDLKSFRNIYMPAPTVEGIKRLMNMDIVKQKKDLKVLNMSELTPLAVEIPYKLEKGEYYPLWYHLGVAMFNKQAEMFEKNIAEKKYDLVLFEYIPTLNNFYPFRVRDSLRANYQLVDSFFAPRRGDTKGVIEVYVP
ncbi:MAG: hypothetical protein J0I32_05455 [Sphingobacteriales bacterium]|nr:hypothetical protein [Sphingobacteriales bacterium]OJW03977.1 MAG: hypothetical protein BGO52_17700 [Sphingobacteriales bacterium 44-61]